MVDTSQYLSIGVNHDTTVVPLNSGEITDRDSKGRFVPGNKISKGRPPGALNFSTTWTRFIEKVATKNNVTPEDIEDQMLVVAFDQIRAGHFGFWKDVQDRVYGSALAKIEHSGAIDNPAATVGVNDVEKRLTAEFNQKIKEAIAAGHGKTLPKTP